MLDNHPADGISGCHTAPGLREPVWPLCGHRPWRSRDHYFPCRRRDWWSLFCMPGVYPRLRWPSSIGADLRGLEAVGVAALRSLDSLLVG